jgi:hypothetical protein
MKVDIKVLEALGVPAETILAAINAEGRSAPRRRARERGRSAPYLQD